MQYANSGTYLRGGADMLADSAGLLAETIAFGAAGLKWKGYSTNAVNGTQPYTLSQPGNMKRLLGVSIFGLPAAPTNETCSLIINADLTLDSVPLLSICPQGPLGHTNNAMPFFPIFRELKGNDDIRFTVTGTAAQNFILILYFMP